MNPAPAIRVECVGKRFRLVHHARSLKRTVIDLLTFRRVRIERMEALCEASFEVARGEVVSLIGRNGSGKSTLLTLLAGIYRPTSGRIEVRGRIASLLDLGAGFHPDLTAADNAIINAMTYGLTRRQAHERLPAMIRYAELGSFADTAIKHFSAGMTMRLGFSVVIHSDPAVLLIDEVLAVGDEAFQQRCRETLREFQAGGGTIVFVSHDLDVVRAISDRVIWLDGGRVRQVGTADEVIAAYLAEA